MVVQCLRYDSGGKDDLSLSLSLSLPPSLPRSLALSLSLFDIAWMRKSTSAWFALDAKCCFSLARHCRYSFSKLQMQEFKEVPASQEPLSVADAAGIPESRTVPRCGLSCAEVFLHPQFLQRSRVVVP